MVRNKTCTLVINGVHARILRGLEDGSTEEPIEICSKAGSTHLGEIMSDNYGRTVASDADGCRAVMESGSDPVRCDMQNSHASQLE